jgi:YHS domain-containing protein
VQDHLRSEDRRTTDANNASTKSVPASAADRESTRQALAKFNGLIGGWRGVGQPVRNSNRGAWSETAEWLWEVKPESLALKYQVENGKLLESARLTYDPSTQTYALSAVLADKTERRYSGKLQGNKLVLDSASDGNGVIHQVTISQLNDKRMVALFQNHPKDSEQLTRVAEVGYTRQGTRLAEAGADGPVCIVTGGKGTLTHVYKGKTYYFCCTGCRDAFIADPEGILAEAAKRKAAAK